MKPVSQNSFKPNKRELESLRFTHFCHVCPSCGQDCQPLNTIIGINSETSSSLCPAISSSIDRNQTTQHLRGTRLQTYLLYFVKKKPKHIQIHKLKTDSNYANSPIFLPLQQKKLYICLALLWNQIHVICVHVRLQNFLHFRGRVVSL